MLPALLAKASTTSSKVGLAHQALAVEDDEDFLWVEIGSHDDYDRLIRGCSLGAAAAWGTVVRFGSAA
jgi:hypothetical protein